jgi:hypothetical protein
MSASEQGNDEEVVKELITTARRILNLNNKNWALLDESLVKLEAILSRNLQSENLEACQLRSPPPLSMT